MLWMKVWCCVLEKQHRMVYSFLTQMLFPLSKINHSGRKCNFAVCIQKHVRALTCYYLNTWQPMPGNVIIDGCDILAFPGGGRLRTRWAAGWGGILALVAGGTLIPSEEDKSLLLFPRGKKGSVSRFTHSFIQKERKRVIVEEIWAVFLIFLALIAE